MGFEETKAKRLRQLERDIARAATDFLALDGWRALKTDPVSRHEWAKGFGEKGMADSLYLRYGLTQEVYTKGPAFGEIMWIEWKTPIGRVAPHQRAWREAERARGALALIAGVDFDATIEGFILWYQQSGLQRLRLRLRLMGGP
jgi:hypothetical protein